MMKNLTEIRDEALEKIAACADNNALNQLRILYLGKKGPIQEVMKTMKDLLKEERPAFGAQINEIKKEISVQIEERHAILETKEMNEAMEQEKLDITLSGECQYASVDVGTTRIGGCVYRFGLSSSGGSGSGM